MKSLVTFELVKKTYSLKKNQLLSTEAQVILDFARKGNHKGLPLQTL